MQNIIVLVGQKPIRPWERCMVHDDRTDFEELKVGWEKFPSVETLTPGIGFSFGKLGYFEILALFWNNWRLETIETRETRD